MSLTKVNSRVVEDHGITAIAINGDKNSQFALKWVADYLLTIKNPVCILVHVQCKTWHSRDSKSVSKEGRPPTQQELQHLFLPYQAFCARKGIEAKEVVLQDIDVPTALNDYIINNSISNIVVGASSRSAFTRKFRSIDVPTILLKSAPESCAVYVISKGKVHASRPSSRPQLPVSADSSATPTQPSHSHATDSKQQNQWGHAPYPVPDSQEEVTSINFSPKSWRNEGVSFDESNNSTVCGEAVLAKKMTTKLHRLQTLESWKLEGAKHADEVALSLAEMEKRKSRAAMEAAEMAQWLAELEAQKRRNAEMRAMNKAEERKKAMEESGLNNVWCRKYTLDELEAATDYFANSNKIGEGGYGPVYKGTLNHAAVAIKVLRPDISQGQRQFRQEVEVLSSMRHPHMVILLGACPEYGCLVYEYMDNGSLEDRLFRNDNTPPITWRTRFKIASEIATGLLFLHETKPEPLVHRDLKPANILLDHNYTTKISDVGLARLVPPSVADNVTQYHLTAAAGTFCYIDPEYQQTGMLGVKSDLYSLGVMLLQLITAQTPMGLSYKVQEAIENGTFKHVLDPTVTDWPVEEALSLAKLALQCCELRKRDRPDLAAIVLPELNRLRDFALNEANQKPETTAHRVNNTSLQINERRKKHRRFKTMTKLWSFSSSSSSSKTSSSPAERSGSRIPPPKANNKLRRSSMIQSHGCWSSFVSCGSAAHNHPPLQRRNSFS